MDTLAKRLTWVMETTGLSQRGLSRAAGLAERHMGFLVSGERDNPELKTLQTMAAALGVSIGWLASGDEPAPDPEALRALGDAFREQEQKARGSAA